MEEVDVEWALACADSLHRLVPEEAIGHAPSAIPTDGPGDLPDLAEMRDLTRRLSASLAGARTPAGPVPLAPLIDMACGDAARAAGGPAGLDTSVPDGAAVAPGCAGPLRDALGRVLRDAVVFGTGRDVPVRIVGHVDRDHVVLVASDRGRSDGADSHVDPRREAGLRAAGGCLAAAGGDLTAGVGPWGGVSVTIRVPAGTVVAASRPPGFSRTRAPS